MIYFENISLIQTFLGKYLCRVKDTALERECEFEWYYSYIRVSKPEDDESSFPPGPNLYLFFCLVFKLFLIEV